MGVGNVLAGVSLSVCHGGGGWLVGMRGEGALMVWSVSVPSPHSHSAAIERVVKT